MAADPRRVLEDAAIQWSRDWDAVFVGFLFGVLVTLAWVGWL